MKFTIRGPMLQPLKALIVVAAAILARPATSHAIDYCGFYCAGEFGCPSNRTSICGDLFGGTCGFGTVCAEFDSFCGSTKVKCYGFVE